MGPKWAEVQAIRGVLAQGQTTVTHTASPDGPEMFSLCLWRGLALDHRVVWEHSSCTRDGVKCAQPFFYDSPMPLLSEVVLLPREGGTHPTLTWTPIEYTEAALAIFASHMNSMTGGWGDGFDKLADWLAR